MSRFLAAFLFLLSFLPFFAVESNALKGNGIIDNTTWHAGTPSGVEFTSEGTVLIYGVPDVRSYVIQKNLDLLENTRYYFKVELRGTPNLKADFYVERNNAPHTELKTVSVGEEWQESVLEFKARPGGTTKYYAVLSVQAGQDGHVEFRNPSIEVIPGELVNGDFSNGDAVWELENAVIVDRSNSDGLCVKLEGIDGSGKSAQYRRLCARFDEMGMAYHHIVFPRYDQESSALIRMYLNGAFGAHPSDVNAYAASTFFAVDRYASYRTDWGEIYENGGLILSDRYTTSNAIHQGSKLPEAELPAFFDWLYDLEYGKMGLPRPDLVLYLDVDLPTSLKRMQHRQEKQNTKADIHEQDVSYLENCLRIGRLAAAHYGWTIVPFMKDGAERALEEKHEEIFSIIRKLHEQGITILLVEQNAKMALSIADRAYVLETGRITMEGDAKELLNNEQVRKAYLGA